MSELMSTGYHWSYVTEIYTCRSTICFSDISRLSLEERMSFPLLFKALAVGFRTPSMAELLQHTNLNRSDMLLQRKCARQSKPIFVPSSGDNGEKHSTSKRLNGSFLKDRFYLFIFNLEGKVTARSIFHLLVHSLNGHSSWSWADLKLLLVLLHEFRGPNIWIILCCCSQILTESCIGSEQAGLGPAPILGC